MSVGRDAPARPISRVLEQLGASLDAFEYLGLPIMVLNRTGTFVWANRDAREVFGEIVGREFTGVVAPGFVKSVREEFVRQILGTAESISQEIELIDRAGRRLRVEFTSVRLQDETGAVGLLGAVTRTLVVQRPTSLRRWKLTDRQQEVLRHLQAGHSTSEIATAMNLSPETVRNHVRGVLRALGVHSRLEAVIATREQAA
jgi:PAS domain S-box-containing protein